MIWESFSDFLHMGGYGKYVWNAYGVTALFIIVELVLVRKRRKEIEKRLLRLARMNRENKA